MYVLTYQMMVGILTREAMTARDAVDAYDELLAAGASLITIRRVGGGLVDITTLRATASEELLPPKPKGWGRPRF